MIDFTYTEVSPPEYRKHYAAIFTVARYSGLSLRQVLAMLVKEK